MENDCKRSRHHIVSYNDSIPGIWPQREAKCFFWLNWQRNLELSNPVFWMYLQSFFLLTFDAVSSQLTTSCEKWWQQTQRRYVNQYQHRVLTEKQWEWCREEMDQTNKKAPKEASDEMLLPWAQIGLETQGQESQNLCTTWRDQTESKLRMSQIV